MFSIVRMLQLDQKNTDSKTGRCKGMLREYFAQKFTILQGIVITIKKTFSQLHLEDF